MGGTAWPEHDQRWIARYRRASAGKHVPAAALEQREHELLAAVRAAGATAAEVFGDPDVLAAEDVAELATPDEAVRAAEGGGARPVVRDVGGSLVALAAIAILAMTVRHGRSVDIDVASALVAMSVVVGIIGVRVGRAFFAAGRSAATVATLVAAGSLVVAGIARAAGVGPDRVVAHDVPVVLLGAALLAPGVALLVLARRMPQPDLRTDWDDAQWLRRFGTGLRARLVPAATARGHVTEIEQALAAGTGSAYAEYGHPLVLARQVSAADRTARARRWWAATAGGTGTPLAVAAFIVVRGTWEALTTPVVIFLLCSALLALVTGWGGRPWADRA